MSVLKDNISMKKYNKMCNSKDREIDIEKIWYLKITTMQVIVGALSMIKQRTGKYINKISGSPSLYEI